MSPLDVLYRQLRKEFPDFEIVEKNSSAFMKVLDVCLKLLSFWQLSMFMTEFVTTVGYTIYTPSSWTQRSESSRIVTLRHEAVHMRQRKKLGAAWFFISYLLLPVPVLWAFCRMKYEMEAYAEGMKASKEVYGLLVLTDAYKENVISQFTTARYLWTWPWRKRIEAWYDGVRADLLK